MTEQAIIYLPFPPSVNRLRDRYNGARLSKKYREWRDAAGWEIKSQKPQKFAGEVGVEVHLVAPDKRIRDGDNLLKATLDLLVIHQIIADDSNRVLREASFKWFDEGHPCTVIVTSKDAA